MDGSKPKINLGTNGLLELLSKDGGTKLTAQQNGSPNIHLQNGDFKLTATEYSAKAMSIELSGANLTVSAAKGVHKVYGVLVGDAESTFTLAAGEVTIKNANNFSGTLNVSEGATLNVLEGANVKANNDGTLNVGDIPNADKIIIEENVKGGTLFLD